MGYTHYFYRDSELHKEKFAKASQDCKKVTEWLKAPIQKECDTPEPPVFTDTLIRFNGIEDNGHETFIIGQKYHSHFPQSDKDGRFFAFCKTARKEYDTAVVACLLVLKYHLGEQIVLKSDGIQEEWHEGLNAVKICLGFGEIPDTIRLGFKK